MICTDQPMFDEDICTCDEDNDSHHKEKHVRIAEQDLTLMYNPKSYVMPDLLHVDAFKESYHKHPNLQFSTRQSTSGLDVRSYLPKNVSTFRRKFSTGFKQLRSRSATDLNIPTFPNSNKLTNTQKLEGRSQKRQQPLECLGIFSRHESMSCIHRLKASASYFKDVPKITLVSYQKIARV